MYSFPMITLPPAFIAEAKRLHKEPDVLYCLELLNETGLSCVPGSGFQQAPGTFHIRTTILVSDSNHAYDQYDYYYYDDDDSNFKCNTCKLFVMSMMIS